MSLCPVFDTQGHCPSLINVSLTSHVDRLTIAKCNRDGDRTVSSLPAWPCVVTRHGTWRDHVTTHVSQCNCVGDNLQARPSVLHLHYANCLVAKSCDRPTSPQSPPTFVYWLVPACQFYNMQIVWQLYSLHRNTGRWATLTHTLFFKTLTNLSLVVFVIFHHLQSQIVLIWRLTCS